jgi:HAD superfamily hydrolase (TIGR01509 family)
LCEDALANGYDTGVARPAALLDVDGTLVDTVYHHALTWYRAFARFGYDVPVWRVHRHIGMGGDQLVAAVAGDRAESEHGDELRATEGDLFGELIDEIRPLAGARDLIETLKDRGHEVVLASSAKQEDLEHYLDLLDARDLADAWTSSADVEATKPEPDLVETALAKVRQDSAVMVGDSTWDAEAAKRASVPTIGLLTGGFSEAELREAGADPVFESLGDLRAGLGDTPLR